MSISSSGKNIFQCDGINFIYPSVVSVPTVYETPTVYDTGGAGPVVIPDDIKIYEKLYAVADIGDTQKINLVFDGTTKDVLLFVICNCKLPSLGSSIEILQYRSNIGPWIRLVWSYNTNLGVQWFNGGNSSNMYIAPNTNYNNTRICLALENNKLKDLFSRSTLDTQNSGYAAKNYNGLRVPSNNVHISDGQELSLYKIGIKDKDGNYLFEFLPAKKSGVAGFYDIINGTFSKASDATAWDCENEVII